MTGFITKRKLRHVQSIGIHNLSIPLIKNSRSTNVKFVKANSCFFTLESVTHDVVYISENQQNVLKSIQFNEIKFEGSPLKHLNLNIYAEIPHEILKDNHEPQLIWTKIATYCINLELLEYIDPGMISYKDVNVPVFKMKDGYFTLGRFTRDSSVADKYNKKIAPTIRNPLKYNSLTVKPSINYNNMIKLNKLVEYQKQINRDLTTISQKIADELNVHKYHITDYKYIQPIENFIKHTEKDIAEKRLKIVQYKKDLAKVDDECSPINRQISAVTIEQDEYGNIYSNLIQLRDRINILRRRRIYKLLTVFKDFPFSNKHFKLFDYWVEEAESSVEEKFKLHTVDYDSVFKRLQNSEETRIQTNTEMGNFVLLLLIITNKIIGIRLPYKLSYYGSTSIIDSHYPLYLAELLSVKQIEKFKVGISMLNTNINQINQFLQSQIDF